MGLDESMDIRFVCPQCEVPARVEFALDTRVIACPHCQYAWQVPDDAFEGGELRRCLCCPSSDLFIRKDFPQRLGVAIVVVGFAASTLAYWNYQVLLALGILFAVAAIDVVLYVLVGDALMCYRCQAQYRGFAGHERHGAFQLQTHERYRQQAARLGQSRPPGLGSPSAPRAVADHHSVEAEGGARASREPPAEPIAPRDRAAGGQPTGRP